MMNKIKIMLLQSYICVASVSAAIITPALPHIEKTFALSHGSIEWVRSIFLLGYVLGQLIYGPIANRFGRLNALRFGLGINLIGIITCLIAVYVNNYFILLAGRLITALGSAAGLSCTFTLINELLTKEQAKNAMSFALVFFTVGIGLSVTAAGIITEYSHWQYCFLVLLIHGSIMFFSTILRTQSSLRWFCASETNILLPQSLQLRYSQFSLCFIKCFCITFCSQYSQF
jgi:MFS family permease